MRLMIKRGRQREARRGEREGKDGLVGERWKGGKEARARSKRQRQERAE